MTDTLPGSGKPNDSRDTLTEAQSTSETPRNTLRRVGIVGTGIGIPEQLLTNADLEKMVDTTDEWIRERTGMCERRLARPDEATSDFAIEAGRGACERAGIAPEDIQLIIVATVTPDTVFPPAAAYVQRALGAKCAAGFDISVACSSFLNALMVGDSLLAAGGYDNALVIGAETLSRIVDYKDRNTCVLFGDGAGAVVLGADSERGVILDHIVRLDGTNMDLITLPAGGSRKPASIETVEAGDHYMKLEGKKVFKFAVKVVTGVVREILERNGFTLDDLDLMIPHQANLRILEAGANKLGLPPEKVAINIQRYGNTSSASVPLILDEVVRSGRLKKGQLACVVAFGGGLSWAATLIRW